MRLKYMFTFQVLYSFKAKSIENMENFTEFGGTWIQNDHKILSTLFGWNQLHLGKIKDPKFFKLSYLMHTVKSDKMMRWQIFFLPPFR